MAAKEEEQEEVRNSRQAEPVSDPKEAVRTSYGKNSRFENDKFRVRVTALAGVARRRARRRSGLSPHPYQTKGAL